MKLATNLALFCLCISLPLITLADEPTGEQLVLKLCSLTNNTQLCLSSFDTVQFDIQNANATGITLFSLKLASKNASAISMLIKTVLIDQTLEPSIQQALEDCSDYYVDAVDLINDAVVALLANAYRDVQTWVLAAVIDVNVCQDALKNYNGAMEKDLSNKTKIFLHLCGNGLTFLKALEKIK
ncbi:hypothetical protein ACFE04_018612 [Oxalis oulophora]